MRLHRSVRCAARAFVLLLVPLCARPSGIRAGPVRLPDDVPVDQRLASQAASRNLEGSDAGVIRRIEFAGLRRIRPATLRAYITSSEGQPLDPRRIEADVRALDRLGWFDSVSAEVHPIPLLLARAETAPAALDPESSRISPETFPGRMGAGGVRVVFVVEERPFLAEVQFRGSRLLSRERIGAVLGEKRASLKVAAPVDRIALWHAARAIEAALAEMGHPRARVRLRLEGVPRAAMRATFEIEDGPGISVGRVRFAGNRAFSEKKLRRQMKRVAPDAALAEIRRKNIYTAERLAEDMERVANFYRNHGYPEARLGQPVAEVSEDRVRRWFPWPRRQTSLRFHLSIPIEEGRFYRLGAVQVESELGGRPAEPVDARAVLPALKPDEPYSQEKLERARETLSQLRASRPVQARSLPPEVEVGQQFDPGAGTVRVIFRVREAQPYMVRRIEFTGQRRFGDRYYRRRILLKEGEPFDAGKLELGLAQLARGGFIRPVKKQDIRLHLDEATHSADLTIRVEEIGRQRLSLVGGGGFGTTLGIVYNVFDLLHGEELLTGHIEGGPQSLQLLLGIAKEGLFGTRASLGLSLFQNVVRPNLPGTAGRQRLFTSRSSGLGLSGAYALTPRDSLGVSYQLLHTSTRYGFSLPAGLAGVPGLTSQLRTTTSSRSLGLNGSHDTGRERLEGAAAVSGGWLGGQTNVVRSSLEYSRLLADPLTNSRNAWAFRGYFAGVSSFRGELPLDARMFAGDQFVRGFRAGELAPYALAKSDTAGRASAFRAWSPGANLVGAVNTEYRVPLLPRTEASAFFDAGSGRLLLNWLGPNRPALLPGTNGVLRASTGVEMRWKLPLVEQTLRVHYAMNPLRLGRSLILPDGSRFHPPDRRSALGWALGSLF